MTPTNDILTDAALPKQPKAVKWFKVYCGIFCSVYVLMVLYSWIIVLDPPGRMAEAEARFMGFFMCVMGLVFSALDQARDEGIFL